MIFTLASATLFLAQAAPSPNAADPPDRWELLRQSMDHWNGSTHSLPTSWFVGAVALLLAALAAASIWKHSHEWLRRFAPLLMFHQVAADLGLGPADEWLLVRIARRQTLPSPLTLLLSRQTLRHHALRYAERCSAVRRDRVLGRVGAISQTLFGEAEE